MPVLTSPVGNPVSERIRARKRLRRAEGRLIANSLPTQQYARCDRDQRSTAGRLRSPL